MSIANDWSEGDSKLRIDRMRLLLQVLIAIMLTVCCARVNRTFAQGIPSVIESNLPIAAPVYTARPRVVPPVPTGKKVVIRVSATINEKGMVVDPIFEANEGDADYLEALNTVIGNWRFRPSIKDCKPEASSQRFAVWFEPGDNGTELSISLPNAKQEAGIPGSASQDSATRKRPVYEAPPNLHFPREASQLGVEGAALYIMSVNQDGSIEHGQVAYSFPLQVFGAAAERAFKKARLKPSLLAETNASSTCFTIPVLFCMEEFFAKHKLPACDRSRGSR